MLKFVFTGKTSARVTVEIIQDKFAWIFFIRGNYTVTDNSTNQFFKFLALKHLKSPDKLMRMNPEVQEGDVKWK